jgi:hypothetical protein
MSRLVQAIVQNHQVSAAQVQDARGQRSLAFDLVAGLLFLPIFSLGSFLACRRLYRRFSSDSRLVWLMATGLASAVASVVGLQSGQLWLSVWEAGRVGNGHMSSFRMATHDRWSHQHVGALFMGGVLLFWSMALLCYRRGGRHGGG